jgi:hypothetical protein
MADDRGLPYNPVLQQRSKPWPLIVCHPFFPNEIFLAPRFLEIGGFTSPFTAAITFGERSTGAVTSSEHSVNYLARACALERFVAGLFTAFRCRWL